MGFAEYYTKGVLNAKQEIILVISHSFIKSYIIVDASSKMSKIEYLMEYYTIQMCKY